MMHSLVEASATGKKPKKNFESMKRATVIRRHA